MWANKESATMLVLEAVHSNPERSHTEALGDLVSVQIH